MDETNDTAAVVEPPWWRPAKAGTRTKQPLSRDAIVDAAIKVLDAEGVDALTIRRLADELGTGPATLYWHIKGKDELGELVYDRIMGDLELPEPDPSRWQEQLKDLARQVYRILRSHNDAARLSLGRIPVGPNMLAVMDWSMGLLLAAGIDKPVAAYIGDLIGRYLDASALDVSVADDEHRDEMFGMLQGYFAGLPAERFPHLTGLSGEMFEMDDQERFELGLEILMRGVETYARPKRPPRPRSTGRASAPGASRRR
ncbi:MAG: TetR/AcrR family transcriptional regulator C-terminal domain-containing protein [Acidimicrobiia bacterium]|nr:TetR/AcrR family transcriptional regulator C-terminal domain-containing protein [Acidimicrobiia bacterium]